MKKHIKNSLKILKKLQHPSGLFRAAPAEGTGYHMSWIRDTVYQALAMEKHDMKRAVKAYQALLDIFLKHEFKIDWAIKEKPDARFKYIHARYDPSTFEEIWEEWGNKQNDAIGGFLFAVGTLENTGVKVLRSVHDYRILQKLVFYLGRVEFWHDEDNGIWEESEEVHASSVGACVAGLEAVRDLLYVPEKYIRFGRQTLDILLPRESETKDVDLALLSLIYPYNVVSEEVAFEIVANVEAYLVRERGVIRYKDDYYYNQDGEAEWTFGFPWLAIIYRRLGNEKKYQYYVQKTLDVMTSAGELPELYYSRSVRFNANTPLGWSQGMFLLAVN